MSEKLAGTFILECWNADGSCAWRAELPNFTTLAGQNHMLATELAAGAQVTTWYLGLIDNAGFVALATADTMASHAGWTEFTSYTESVRQTWTPGAVALQSVTNASAPGVFTVNAAGVLNGVFLASVNTKGGTTGTLFSEASAAQTLTVASGQVVSVTYPYSAGGG